MMELLDPMVGFTCWGGGECEWLWACICLRIAAEEFR